MPCGPIDKTIHYIQGQGHCSQRSQKITIKIDHISFCHITETTTSLVKFQFTHNTIEMNLNKKPESLPTLQFNEILNVIEVFNYLLMGKCLSFTHLTREYSWAEYKFNNGLDNG